MAEAVGDKPSNDMSANGTSDKSNEAPASNMKVSDEKSSEQLHGEQQQQHQASTAKEKQADEMDEHEHYGRQKESRRGRDSNDRGRGRGRGRSDRGRSRGRGSGRGGRGNSNNHRREYSDHARFERQDESSDAAEIRRQVEFYFSDSNLPIDRYLLDETGGHANKPVPLKQIHNFKRMRHFQPYSAVVDAVKKSDFLTVNDKDEVSRREPLDSKFGMDTKENQDLLTTDSMLRSIYAKGFRQNDHQLDIERFFQPFGIKGVRLRRDKHDFSFRGSVFVEFESEEAAKQFLEMEDKPTWGPDNIPLTYMSKKEYVEVKNDAIHRGEVKPSSPSRRHSDHRDWNQRGRGRGRGRGGFNGGHHNRKRSYPFEGHEDHDSDDWRARRDKFQRSEDLDENYQPPDNTESTEDQSANGKRAEDGADTGELGPEKESEPAKADEEGEAVSA